MESKLMILVAASMSFVVALFMLGIADVSAQDLIKQSKVKAAKKLIPDLVKKLKTKLAEKSLKLKSKVKSSLPKNSIVSKNPSAGAKIAAKILGKTGR